MVQCLAAVECFSEMSFELWTDKISSGLIDSPCLTDPISLTLAETMPSVDIPKPAALYSSITQLPPTPPPPPLNVHTETYWKANPFIHYRDRRYRGF